MRPRPAPSDYEPVLYEVTVWDIVNGDVVKKLWHATDAEATAVEKHYADDPQYHVIVEEIS